MVDLTHLTNRDGFAQIGQKTFETMDEIDIPSGATRTESIPSGVSLERISFELLGGLTEADIEAVTIKANNKEMQMFYSGALLDAINIYDGRGDVASNSILNVYFGYPKTRSLQEQQVGYIVTGMPLDGGVAVPITNLSWSVKTRAGAPAGRLRVTYTDTAVGLQINNRFISSVEQEMSSAGAHWHRMDGFTLGETNTQEVSRIFLHGPGVPFVDEIDVAIGHPRRNLGKFTRNYLYQLAEENGKILPGTSAAPGDFLAYDTMAEGNIETGWPVRSNKDLLFKFHTTAAYAGEEIWAVLETTGHVAG